MMRERRVFVFPFLGLVLPLLLVVWASAAFAAGKLSYHLKPQKIAKDVYIFEGSTDHFALKNGGNIVNTGFIVAPDGVIVIDTGPSYRYGREMRKAIGEVTSKPLHSVIITHDHPDHYLGNLAFKDLPIMALPETINIIKEDGDAVAEGMYRMVGDWMRGTEVVAPTKPVTSGEITLAGRTLDLIGLQGHTRGDLAVFDKTSGVLFAGDLTFYKRTPTFPSATTKDWLISLRKLGEIPFKRMVPGHGPVVDDARAIEATTAYINWLENTLRAGVNEGADMNEIMAVDIPKPFNKWTVARKEWIRSVIYQYPGMEAKLLPRIDGAGK